MTAVLDPAQQPRTLPALDPNRELVLPASRERTLPNGLTVIAVERRSVPLVELRLRIPFSRAALDPTFVATSTLLSQTLFSGTSAMSTVEIAAELQKYGAALSASVDSDRLLISGNGLAGALDEILRVLAHVLAQASYPRGEVATERARLVDRITVAQSQPTHLARVAFLARLYPHHPYALQTPTVEDVQQLDTPQLAALHAARVTAAGATLVVVGDIDALATLDRVEAALGGWSVSAGASPPEVLPAAPPLTPGPIVLADRPGVVQSSLRLALPAVPRNHPDHAPLQLANLIFGGYFSSRWMENLREDKGYTYGAHSSVEHSVAGSVLLLGTEVATGVTAAALLETWYELGRLAVAPPSANELEQARQYAMGALLLGLSTQSGLAALASTLAGFGLRLNYLAEQSVQLGSAAADQVAMAAATYMAPAKAVVVILGDGEHVADPLAALWPIDRHPASPTGIQASHPGGSPAERP